MFSKQGECDQNDLFCDYLIDKGLLEIDWSQDEILEKQ